MKKIALVLVIFCSLCAYSQVNIINPIVRSVGNLNISIDPRMELLNAAQLVSNTPYIDRQKTYSQEAIIYFKPFSSEKVVALTDELIQGDYSFGLDAPPEFMLHFLKQYAHLLPFKIENETIYADKEYTDPNLRLMFCVPNPQNSETGMIVFTAISNSAYQNSVRISMDTDYLLFLDSENILSKGFFKKDGKWEFERGERKKNSTSN